MKLEPIFLFSNWRTAGTALAFSFRTSTDCYVYTEPFNPTLKDKSAALSANTGSWNSKHPKNQKYFEEYIPLLDKEDFVFPDMEKIPYVAKEDDSQKELLIYLETLISYAQSLNKIPVFKLEQSEGAMPWFKAKFPGALFVGVTRKHEYQYISWLEQATFGNASLFFLSALRLINNNPDFFDSEKIELDSNYDPVVYREIFNTFKKKMDCVHSKYADFCIDISPETDELLEEQIEKVKQFDVERLSLWQGVLSNIRNTLEKMPATQVSIERLENHVKTLGKYEEAQKIHASVLSDYQRVITNQNEQFIMMNQQVNDYERAMAAGRDGQSFFYVNLFFKTTLSRFFKRVKGFFCK